MNKLRGCNTYTAPASFLNSQSSEHHSLIAYAQWATVAAMQQARSRSSAHTRTHTHHTRARSFTGARPMHAESHSARVIPAPSSPVYTRCPVVERTRTVCFADGVPHPCCFGCSSRNDHITTAVSAAMHHAEFFLVSYRSSLYLLFPPLFLRERFAICVDLSQQHITTSFGWHSLVFKCHPTEQPCHEKHCASLFYGVCTPAHTT